MLKQKVKEKEFAPSHEEIKPKTAEKVTVFFGSLGSEAREITLAQGATLGDLLKEVKMVGKEVRVNRTHEANSYELKEGDVVVVVPEPIVGGA